MKKWKVHCRERRGHSAPAGTTGNHLHRADGLTFFTFLLSCLHYAGRFVALLFRWQDLEKSSPAHRVDLHTGNAPPFIVGSGLWDATPA